MRDKGKHTAIADIRNYLATDTAAIKIITGY